MKFLIENRYYLLTTIVCFIIHYVIKVFNKSNKTEKMKRNSWLNSKITKIEKYNYNTLILRLECNFNIPIGKHVMIKGTFENKNIMRSYTPINIVNNKYIDLMIKIYKNGKMSKYISNLKVGDYIELKGPVGSFKYESNHYKHILLIAAGSGITPCYQIMKNICCNELDDTKISLLFQNREEKDILLKEEITSLVNKNPNLYNFCFSLSKIKDKSLNTSISMKENYHVGYIDKQLLSSYLNKDLVNYKIMLCGPNGFIKSVKNILIKDLNCEKDYIYVF